MSKKIIIGIDPGTRRTGYAVVRKENSSLVPIDFGCIRPPLDLTLSSRYEVIFLGIQKLIEQFSPQEMAIETPFVAKNPQSALKLGIALACALLAGKTRGLRVFGYSPREVKSSIVGTGKASKEAIQLSIMRHLSLTTPPSQQDAADALAIALCHIRKVDVLGIHNHTTKEL
jgi:crossover junction endodeoxyribonuclease RuvC